MFRLIDEFQTLRPRDFVIANPNLVIPGAVVNPLVIGEWLQLDSSYRAVRGGNGANAAPATPDDEASVPSWVFFGEQGMTDIQAAGKVPLLFNGFYEAETDMVHMTGITLGCAVAVFDVDDYLNAGGITRRCLAIRSAGLTVGYVTKIDTTNSRIRFVRATY